MRPQHVAAVEAAAALCDATVETGFTLTADNGIWNCLPRGELGVVNGVMSGQFDYSTRNKSTLSLIEGRLMAVSTRTAKRCPDCNPP